MTNDAQKTLTIVSVTGHQDYAQGSAYSIMRSFQELQKKLPAETLRCLLVSPEKPADCPDYVLHLPCKPFGYMEYNVFIIYSLGQLIETDFALIVQNDGFVLNGENWRNEFFDYDYIGAPLPTYFTLEDGIVSNHGSEEWEAAFGNLPTNAIEPQNGGFSLRSKRLLELPRALGLPWTCMPPSPFTKTPLELEYGILWHNEDIFLTVAMREILEQQGVRFAPTALANLFSVESFNVPPKFNVNPLDILGVHTMNQLVMSSVNETFMHKKVQMYDNNIYSNALCQVLLGNNIDIRMPQHYLEG